MNRLKTFKSRRLLSSNTSTSSLSYKYVPISVLDHYSPDDWKAIHESQKPVLLRGIAKDWPAVATSSDRKWSNLRKLKERIEKDTMVQVEVGENYMDPNIRQPMVHLESFLDYVLQGSETPDSLPQDAPRIYLAQYDINQIPIMRDDIMIPEICLQTGKGHQYRQYIWFGTHSGTNSPCHTDPFQNILVQVIGEKEVLLVDPKYSSCLYPALGTTQKNTSLVNFANPDYNKHPLFAQVECIQAKLAPGDGLFIPYKWWHYAAARNLSCSVNFWWL